MKSWFGAEKNIIESKTTKPTGSSPITEIEDIQEIVQEIAIETRLDLMEAKDLEEIITQSLYKLEKFKNDSVRYGVGVKLWERYSCLEILKKAKYAQCAHEAMEILEEVNQHVLSIVAQVIAQEPNDGII